MFPPIDCGFIVDPIRKFSYQLSKNSSAFSRLYYGKWVSQVLFNDQYNSCLIWLLQSWQYYSPKLYSLEDAFVQVLGQYAQRHYAQGHYAQENYVQTEITPNEIKLFEANRSNFFQVIIWRGLNICCMARSLGSLRQVATLRHGHMARRSASLRSCI